MLVIGHRGAKGEAPENTIGGFRYALDKGITHFELDVRLSADGVPVVIHDATTRRTTGRKFRVEQCSALQLARMDAASKNNWPFFERVPTLLDIIPLLEISDSVQLEIKADQPSRQHALLRSIGEALKHADPQRYTITSVDTNILALAATVLPQFRRGLLCSRPMINYLAIANRLGCELLVFQHRILSRKLIEQAHRSGFEVSTYTTNDIRRIKKLGDFGVDSIITDYPVKYRHLQPPARTPQSIKWPPLPLREAGAALPG